MISLVENESHYGDVVEQIILKSRYRLDIATATLKALTIVNNRKGETIVKCLARKADEGLQIRILHASVPSEWFIKLAKKENLKNKGNLILRRCPRVHQKSIIGDGRLLYIGSANLTGAGIGAKSPRNRNFELGFVTDEIRFIDRADSLFELIWCGDMCVNCGRKKICPSPLEEFRF
jgi:phosphatidylserine/phosphatidylglycerophosphate/cardiolipin synthase-like enzyme